MGVDPRVRVIRGSGGGGAQVDDRIRLAAVLDAIGPLWDPAEVYSGEAEAQRMLYAHLNPEQQATYDVLIAAGVLPDSRGER